MKNIIRKLKSKAGESLVESMAAILIFTLSSIALLSMISASADINRTAKVADEQFQQQMTVVEKAEITDAKKGTATFKVNEQAVAQPDVYICQEKDNENALYAYYLMPKTTEDAQK
ncbi:MAG: hypothetical protein PUC58_01295 [Oscillospiraceae bacterium]|nr:hypothetical protein [Oscillospiraceae bacterium]